MKKLLITSILILFPFLVSAKTFDSDLYFGITNDPDVQMLQEFLTDQGVYSGPITGNFFSLTLVAVKKYQSQNNITPAAGFFGPITRVKANEILSVQIQNSDTQAITETGTIVPTPTTNQNLTTDNNQLIQNLQAQILAFQQQLAQMQQQNQTIQNQQTQIQSQQTQIQQNQQNQISSIQQQTNQQTSNNQQSNTQSSTQNQTQNNQVVQQPVVPPLKPAYKEKNWVVNKFWISQIDVDNWWPLGRDVTLEETQEHNKGFPNEASIQNRDNTDVPIKNLGAKWRLEINGQAIAKAENTVMFCIDVYRTTWLCNMNPLNFRFKPETTYNYTIYYEEVGRETSTYSGTFTTGTKEWLESHDFLTEL